MQRKSLGGSLDATVHGSPSVSLIDSSRIDEMIDDFGEEEFCEIVAAFLEDMEAALAQLSIVLAADDTEEIGKLLHLVKGCAANLGIVALVELCETTKAGMQKGPGDSASIISSFRSLHNAAADILRQQCA